MVDEKTYLFFDIECANCFDGVGKMCSYGYVLVDSDFNVLDTDDVVMNPETDFDWYLFSPKNKCPLAYSKDYFRAQRNFDAYYKPIKNLMEAANRRILGFATPNDIGFIADACDRYGLPYINFSAYDIAPIAAAGSDTRKKLVEWCQEYGVDLSQIKAHKSQDDALMTMLLAKAICQKTGLSMEELLAQNKGSRLSMEKFLEQREYKRAKEEAFAKVKNLYGKKCKSALTHRLSGDYSLNFKTGEDFELTLKIAELVYKHGGILKKSLKNSGTAIIDNEVTDETTKKIKSKGMDAIKIDDFLELVNMERKK